MTRSTPPKPIDIARALPFLSQLERQTVRLHPRRGHPAITDSSIGGELVWPADDAWPRCAMCEPKAVPMVPVAQLWLRDVPELPVPAGRDLLQVLWCPAEHMSYGMANVITIWRDSQQIHGSLAVRPQPNRELSDGHHLPHGCTVSPERVIEHPALWELSEEEQRRIQSWESTVEWRYGSDFDAAPGTKVGGWPRWLEDPEWPSCADGHTMEHLLTIASWEFDAGSWKTWLPQSDVEELRRVEEAGGRPFLSVGAADLLGPGIRLRNAGNVYVFVCVQCPDRPTAARVQY